VCVYVCRWTDPDGHIPALRSHLKETFPNASKRQVCVRRRFVGGGGGGEGVGVGV